MGSIGTIVTTPLIKHSKRIALPSQSTADFRQSQYNAFLCHENIVQNFAYIIPKVSSEGRIYYFKS